MSVKRSMMQEPGRDSDCTNIGASGFAIPGDVDRIKGCVVLRARANLLARPGSPTVRAEHLMPRGGWAGFGRSGVRSGRDRGPYLVASAYLYKEGKAGLHCPRGGWPIDQLVRIVVANRLNMETEADYVIVTESVGSAAGAGLASLCATSHNECSICRGPNSRQHACVPVSGNEANTSQ